MTPEEVPGEPTIWVQVPQRWIQQEGDHTYLTTGGHSIGPVLDTSAIGGHAYSDHHIVDLREDGWTVQHPLSCRPNLFDCPVNKAAERDLDRPAELGRFICGLGDDGRFEIGDRIEEAFDQPDDQEARGEQ